MRFRTLALALALCCGLSVAGQAAAKKPSVRHAYKAKKFKAKKFKANKHLAKRASKSTVKKHKG